MRKTNKYIKYIKRFSIMIVTLLLSFTIMSKDVHAINVGSIYVENTRALYKEVGSTSEYSIFQWQIYSTPNGLFYSDVGMVLSELVGFDSTTRVFSFRTDVLNYVELNYPSYQRIYLPDLQYMVMTDGTAVSSPTPVVDFYDASGANILSFNYADSTNLQPGTYPINIKFEILTYDYEFYNVAYNDGYNNGYDDGILEGRDTYGYYDASTNTWLTGAQARLQGYGLGEADGYADGYSVGYDDGLLEGIGLSDQESYDKGYIDGSEDSFMASIKDWIVPAIIVVLFLGGAISVIVKKREG